MPPSKNSTTEVAHDILVSADDNGHFERIETFKRRARKTYTEAERPYKCEFCTRSYAFEHSRNQHIRLKHIAPSKFRTTGARKEVPLKASKLVPTETTRGIRSTSLTDNSTGGTFSAYCQDYVSLSQSGTRVQMPPHASMDKQWHRVDVGNDLSTEQFVGVSGLNFQAVQYSDLSPASRAASMTSAGSSLPWRGTDNIHHTGLSASYTGSDISRTPCSRRASDTSGCKSAPVHPYRRSVDNNPNDNRLDDLLVLLGQQQRVRQSTGYSPNLACKNGVGTLESSSSCDSLKSASLSLCGNQGIRSLSGPQSCDNLRTRYTSATLKLPTPSEHMQIRAREQASINNQQAANQRSAHLCKQQNTISKPETGESAITKQWMSIFNTYLQEKGRASSDFANIGAQTDAYMPTNKGDLYKSQPKCSTGFMAYEQTLSEISAEDAMFVEEDGSRSTGSEGQSIASRSTITNDGISSANTLNFQNQNRFTFPSPQGTNFTRGVSSMPSQLTDVESMIELSTENARNNCQRTMETQSTRSSAASAQGDSVSSSGRRLPSDMSVDFVCSILKSLESA